MRVFVTGGSGFLGAAVVRRLPERGVEVEAPARSDVTVADLTGSRRSRVTVPPVAIRAVAPLGRLVGPLVGVEPDLREAVHASDWVTYWGSSGKAGRELGHAPRTLDQGLCDLLAAG